MYDTFQKGYIGVMLETRHIFFYMQEMMKHEDRASSFNSIKGR